jgi:succinate-semialdehyde dehydrogenase/glutarate-semialdehyde dehydrogenase
MTIATVSPTTGITERRFEPYSRDDIQRKLITEQRAFDFASRAIWIIKSAEIFTAEPEPKPVSVIRATKRGKTLQPARPEVLECAKTKRLYAKHAGSSLAGGPLTASSSVGAKPAFARYEPPLMVLAVIPCNYPPWRVIGFAAPALMAGNVGLLKHALNAPQPALYLDTILPSQSAS